MTYEFKFLKSKKIITANVEKQVGKEDEIKNEKMAAAFEKASLKKYTLKFSAYNSEFEEMQQLEKPDVAAAAGIKMSLSFNKGVLYKDLKLKKLFEECYSLDDKKFIVNSELEVFDWKIGNEIKKIGNYNCLKATATIKVTQKQLKDYEEKSKNKKSLFVHLMKPPTDTEIIAWFTNEIPISNGPDKYQVCQV